MTSRLVALAAALSLAAPGLAAQQLTPKEQQIASAVDARADAAVALLRQLVNVNSGTMNFEGVREVGRRIGDELEALGFQTEWVDGAAWNRAGHLVARHPGGGPGPHLLLIGHLDTVFPKDSPFQRWTDLTDSTATGPGSIDMKGGDVIILEALRALKSAGVLDPMNITVVMSGDEESSGSPLDRARATLRDAARQADVALAFEDGDNDPKTAVVARRGASGWRLDVTGTPSHSSQIFQPGVGAGAVYEMARVLTDFYRTLAGERLLTFNPGVALGGTTVDYDPDKTSGTAFGKDNVVAEHATVAGDIRTISLEQLAATQDRMRFIVRQSLPGASSTITFDEGYPPMAPTEGNRRLLALFDQASRDLGHGPVTAVDPRNAGAADVSFTAGLVDMAIDGLGAGGGSEHTEKEWIDIPTLRIQTRRTAVLIYRLEQRPLS